VVSQYALAFPEVKFSLSNDGRVALRTPGSGRLIDSIIEVYGAEIAKNMVEVKDISVLPPQVAGMVGSPKVSRSGRGYLSFFVNRRWVNSRLLARAVEEAYHGLLTSGKHPVAIINISLPPEEVDVNIHPTKSEIKFRDEHQIFTAVRRAVRHTLVEQLTVPEVKVVAEEASPWEPRGAVPTTTVEVGPPARALTPILSLPVLRVMGQLDNSYIVTEGPDGLYLIDQHAAHERVLFEWIEHQRSQKEIEVQGLLEPMTLEVSPRQDEVLRSHYEDLAEFGFSIEPFGARTFLVRTVPALVYKKDWIGMIKELLDLPPEADRVGWVEAVARSMACHSAIRAGQTLTDSEMRELVRQLEQANNPHTCPHGRPTMIHLSSGRIKREFGRT